jgi:hypothetical protein
MITRSGRCKCCKERHSEKSKYEWLAELKFNLWLYKHYKKEHKTNILIKIILRKLNIG